MGVYIGIDLHSNNCFVTVIEESGKVVYEKRLSNDLQVIVSELEPYRDHCEGVVVESTFNWYWLVDGLMGAGYGLHLANTAAIQQYYGMKYTDDKSDARWLAQMLRLKVLPEGYIYPKGERAVRDLLRKRSRLVQQKVSQMLSLQNLVSRNAGVRLNGNAVKALTVKDLDRFLPDPLVARAAKSNLRVYRCLAKEIEGIEETVLARVKGSNKPKGSHLAFWQIRTAENRWLSQIIPKLFQATRCSAKGLEGRNRWASKRRCPPYRLR